MDHDRGKSSNSTAKASLSAQLLRSFRTRSLPNNSPADAAPEAPLTLCDVPATVETLLSDATQVTQARALVSTLRIESENNGPLVDPSSGSPLFSALAVLCMRLLRPKNPREMRRVACDLVAASLKYAEACISQSTESPALLDSTTSAFMLCSLDRAMLFRLVCGLHDPADWTAQTLVENKAQAFDTLHKQLIALSGLTRDGRDVVAIPDIIDVLSSWLEDAWAAVQFLRANGDSRAEPGSVVMQQLTNFIAAVLKFNFARIPVMHVEAAFERFSRMVLVPRVLDSAAAPPIDGTVHSEQKPFANGLLHDDVYGVRLQKYPHRPPSHTVVSEHMPIVNHGEIEAMARVIDVSLCYGLISPNSLIVLVLMSCRLRGCSIVRASASDAAHRIQQPHPALWLVLTNLLRSHCANATLRIVIQTLWNPNEISQPVMDVHAIMHRPSVAVGALLILQAVVRQISTEYDESVASKVQLPSLSLAVFVGAVSGAAQRQNPALDFATVFFLRFGLSYVQEGADDLRPPFERIFDDRLVDNMEEIVAPLVQIAQRHVPVWKSAARPPTNNEVAFSLRITDELLELVQQPLIPLVNTVLAPLRNALAPLLPDDMLVDIVAHFRGKHEYVPGAPEWIERITELVDAFFFRESECTTALPADRARAHFMELICELYDSVQDMPQYCDPLVRRVIVPVAERVLPYEAVAEVVSVLRHMLLHAAVGAALDPDPSLFNRIRAIYAACVSSSQQPPDVRAEYALAQHSRQTSTGPSNADAERERSMRSRRAVNAVTDLISVFQQLAFMLPSTAAAVGTSVNMDVCRTRAAHATAVLFRDLIRVVQQGAVDPVDGVDMDAAAPRVARITALQWLMHLRANRYHSLFFADNVAEQTESVAQLLRRTPSSQEREGERGRERERTERTERAMSRSRMVERSRERTPNLPRIRPSAPLWSIPESFPFTPPPSGLSSDVAYVYQGADVPQDAPLLPTSDYLTVIVQILQSDFDWEVVSYVLVHLPAQLRNKHMFCSARAQIPALLAVLCHALQVQRLMPNVILPDDVRRSDVYAVAYNTLVVLISYRSLLSRAQQDELVEVFIAGLSRSQNTAQPCIRALVLACHELQKSVTRHASAMLVKLSTVMSSIAMSAHILELIVEIGSVPAAYSNFTDAEYKRVFGIALQYIQFHQSTAAADREDIRSSPAMFSLSQYVMILAYFIIAQWFMLLRLLERPKYVSYITRGLMLANDGRQQLSDQTTVCLDFLARYTYSSAAPKPTNSLIRFLVAGDRQNAVARGASEASLTRTWLIGKSLVTITSLQRQGWFEFVIRRPSGTSSFISKLENSPSYSLESDESTANTLLMLFNKLHIHTNLGDVLPSPQLPGAASTLDACSQENPNTCNHANTDVSAEGRDVSKTISQTGQEFPMHSAPRRREATSDPAYVALQFSGYPEQDVSHAPHLLTPGPATDRLLRGIDLTPVYDFHKIGVLYVGYGQESETEILSNNQGSRPYMRFLSGLGDLVTLRGQQDVYTGGLDRQNDEHGKYTYAWRDSNVQVVYHTATMMPSRDNDPNCASKKALIGNDWVHIVFNESNRPYRFGTIASQFNFVNIVISPHSSFHGSADETSSDDETYYLVELQRRPGLPDFSPVGEGQLVSLSTLPRFVRMLSVNCDLMSQIFLDTGESMVPYTSSESLLTRLGYASPSHWALPLTN